MTAAPVQKLLFSWLAFGVVLTGIPAAAGAGDKTLVLLEVEGESTPRLLKSLERMVKTEHEVLPGSVYRDAARRLRAQKLTPNNVKKVCAYLKVDGVVDGMVVAEDDGSYRFLVRVRSAANGIIEKKIPMRLVEARLSEAMSDKLAERLMIAIDGLPPVDKDGEEATRVAGNQDGEKGSKKKGRQVVAASQADPDKKTDRARKKGGEDEDQAVSEEEELADSRQASKKRGGSAKVASAGASARKAERDADRRPALNDGGEGQGGEEEIEESDENEKRDELAGSTERKTELAAGQTSPRTTPLLVHAGVSFIGRKLTFSSTAGATDPPPGYSGSPVPGAYIEGEVYPLLFAGKRGLLAKLGIGVVIDRVIGLNSAVPDATGMGTIALPTRMWRYGANLRYRHNFGSGPNGYSVQGSLGYNTAGFSISKQDAPGGPDSVDVPNVNYKYVDLGVDGRIPITGPFTALGELKLLFPLDSGAMQTTTQYGAGSSLGYEAEAAVEYLITPKIQVRAGARLMTISSSFDGTGALTDRDMNGQPDVTGASDRFLGGFVTGGYCF